MAIPKKKYFKMTCPAMPTSTSDRTTVLVNQLTEAVARPTARPPLTEQQPPPTQKTKNHG